MFPFFFLDAQRSPSHSTPPPPYGILAATYRGARPCTPLEIAVRDMNTANGNFPGDRSDKEAAAALYAGV